MPRAIDEGGESLLGVVDVGELVKQRFLAWCQSHMKARKLRNTG